MPGASDSTKEARRKEWRLYMENLYKQRLAQRQYRVQNMFGVMRDGPTMADYVRAGRGGLPSNITVNYEGGGRGGPGGRP